MCFLIKANVLNSYLKGENNNPLEILFDIRLELSSFFLILTQNATVKKGKYSARQTLLKNCKCIKCSPDTQESAGFRSHTNNKMHKSVAAISASNRLKSTNITFLNYYIKFFLAMGTYNNLKQSTEKENIQDSPNNFEEFASCIFEESFQKDFEDLNSKRTNTQNLNDDENQKRFFKNTDKIYEFQKIILVLRISSLKLHIQKFRDNKIESKENVNFWKNK